MWGSVFYQLAMLLLERGKFAAGWRLMTRASDPRAAEFRQSARLVRLVAKREMTVGIKALSALDGIADPLLAAIDDPDDLVSCTAIRELGRRRERRALQRLLDLAQSLSSSPQKAWDRRAHAMIALGELGDPHAVPPLLDLLADPAAASGAAWALGALGDQRAVDPLLDALHNGQWYAIKPLGDLGAGSAAPILLSMTSNTGLAESAVRGLEEILSRNAGSVAQDELAKIARLDGVQKYSVSASVRFQDSSGRTHGAAGAGLVPVSCVRVRALASKELEKRRAG